MSLNPLERRRTKKEFVENIKLTGLSESEIAADLQISVTTLQSLLMLKPKAIEDVWILRNYLLEKVRAQGKTPVPFTALKGNPEDYWFIDSQKVLTKQIS
ncbi:DUF2316 family protein [Enterococcus sp. LJL90]